MVLDYIHLTRDKKQRSKRPMKREWDAELGQLDDRDGLLDQGFNEPGLFWSKEDGTPSTFVKR